MNVGTITQLTSDLKEPPFRSVILPAEPPEFRAFPKIQRLFRDMIVTEKIDGTNAAVVVTDDGQVAAQSRTRLLSPGKSTDNFGFAAWVQDHADELRDGLGVGHHYGEWYGRGIQRGYGLEERRFALFNTSRWEHERPRCCECVPVLGRHTFDTPAIKGHLDKLRWGGSRAVPGWDRAEGIVVYHSGGHGTLFKALLENDDIPKGAAA